MKIGRTKRFTRIYSFRENIWDAQNKQFSLPIPIFFPIFLPFNFSQERASITEIETANDPFLYPGGHHNGKKYIRPRGNIHIQGKSHVSLPLLAILHMEQPSIPLETRTNLGLKRWNEFFSSCSFPFYSQYQKSRTKIFVARGENFKLHGKQLKNRGKNRVNEEETRMVKNRRWEGKRLTIF